MFVVKVIADSINPLNDRITTFELTYPRMIHSELMTHRMFSRNAASSRAIPAKILRGLVWNSPAMPVHWGINKSGMSADGQLTGFKLLMAKKVWRATGKAACIAQKCLEKIGLHKQITNRMLEPWQYIRTVVTATEYDNWFWLRDHEDAQPEIAALASMMHESLQDSMPRTLEWGQWHLPYADDEEPMPLVDRVDVSVSCCAQVSYRRNDRSLEKAKRVVAMLTNGSRLHASPFEHQAKAVNYSKAKANAGWPEGFTHLDTKGALWSGNFKGWVQKRQVM